MNNIKQYIQEKLILNKTIKKSEKNINEYIVSDEYNLFDIQEFIDLLERVYKESKCEDIVIAEIEDDRGAYMLNKPSIGNIEWYIDNYNGTIHFLGITLFNKTNSLYINKNSTNKLLNLLSKKKQFKKVRFSSNMTGALSYKYLHIYYSKRPHNVIKIYLDNSK